MNPRLRAMDAHRRAHEFLRDNPSAVVDPFTGNIYAQVVVTIPSEEECARRRAEMAIRLAARTWRPQ